MTEDLSISQVLVTVGVVVAGVLVVRHINRTLARKITEKMEAKENSEAKPSK
jgi:hypothetical protein